MYGKTFESNSNSSSFNPGINEGVCMTKFECHDIKTPKYNGKVLDIEWTKNGSIMSTRLFPINADKNPLKSEYRDGSLVELDAAESLNKAYAEFNSYLRNICCNYCSVSDFEAIQATDFADYCMKIKALLGSNFHTKEGYLMCGIKKGYLGVPRQWYECKGKFFAMEESELSNLHKSFSMTRVNQEVEEMATSNGDEW